MSEVKDETGPLYQAETPRPQSAAPVDHATVAKVADHENRLTAIEDGIATGGALITKYGPMLDDLAHVAAVAADKGMSLGQILSAVAVQLLGHDLKPKPLPAP